MIGICNRYGENTNRCLNRRQKTDEYGRDRDEGAQVSGGYGDGKEHRLRICEP